MPSFAGCNASICPYDHSYYQYRIELAPNAFFLAWFGTSLIAFLGTFLLTRRGASFTTAMVLGELSEIIGYAGRIMSWKDQWGENGFLIQICCLTIAPAFLAAGIYLSLQKIVATYGPENSRIPYNYYTRIFIPCDVVSLILQAVGGALASLASHRDESTTTGDNIMIAGLTFQVFTLLIFMILCADFALHVRKRQKTLGAAALTQDPELVAIRESRQFKGFLFALALSTICIFWRCVFRVAELSDGWTGPIMARQNLFYGFEGTLISAAVLALNIFHPSLAFKHLMGPRHNFKFWARKPAGHDSGAKDLDTKDTAEAKDPERNAGTPVNASGHHSSDSSDGEKLEKPERT